MIAAEEALLRLQEGNARFVSGEIASGPEHYRYRREQIVLDQEPFAIVVGCSDSRVPVEIVFDQGLGDLFVIRIAGNVISRTQLGSIEFSAMKHGARLVVVLGHTGCGAMKAAVAAVEAGAEPESDNLRVLVDQIRPAVARAGEFDCGCASGERVDRVGRENVRQAVEAIKDGSDIIRRLVEEDGLVITGAEYSLATGAVEFFDGDSA
ncbi:MAG TPA: carbonic anhydrase [Woeseiaceae bacterium]|nr:carbonic anhydrase [Woeseiaceae bacterium]